MLSRLPQQIDIEVYRGDTFSKRLFVGVEEDEDTETSIPINFTGHQFAMSVSESLTDPLNSLIFELLPDKFFLGQTQDAIDYDVQEGNPPGTTKDEVHIYVEHTTMRVPSGEYVYDLESRDPSGDIRTRLVGSFTVYPDVTRKIEYS